VVRLGKTAIIEQFLADGLSYMFGNPGTVEQGFLDELEKFDGFHYILALQETVAAGIADGYARATGGPALLQLHSGVGLGNAIGMLYQSKRGHTPLVVVAGESGVRYEAMDAQMAADLVAMARPVTKYATRVTDPNSVLRVLRRALKIAMTPPRGPVFVALPMDVLDAPNTEPVVPTHFPHTQTVPVPRLVKRAGELLAGARRPIVLIGDGVSVSEAQPELTRVAELLGADVWGVEFAEADFDTRHPLWRGQLGHMFGEVSAAAVREADAVLVVGTYLFPEVFPALENPFRRDARIVHIDLDAYEIAKNHPVALGLVADPKSTLDALVGELDRVLTEDQRIAAVDRLRQRAAETTAAPDDGSMLATFARTLAERGPAGHDRLRRGAHLVAGDRRVSAGGPATALVRHPRRLARGRHSRRGRHQAGHAGQDRDRLHRRRRQHVHDPGAGHRRSARHRREVRGVQQPQLRTAQREHRAVLAGT
jgi:benzoylformate decarboxylase